MTSLKRLLARQVERMLDARIVRPNTIGILFEEEQLKRFFTHFGVDCVFDVGANAGQYAKMLRQRMGFRGPIISFEPNPALAECLRMQAASDPQWHVEETALGEREGSAEFNIMESDRFSSLLDPATSEVELLREKNWPVRRITVKISTLQWALASYKAKLGFGRPFLKMDTQGNDLAVAEGAGERIRSFVGLQSELAIKRIYDNAPTYEQSLSYYSNKGFELSALVPNNLGHFPRLVEIDCIMYRDDLVPH